MMEQAMMDQPRLEPANEDYSIALAAGLVEGNEACIHRCLFQAPADSILMMGMD
jgi:hypothetical protein